MKKSIICLLVLILVTIIMLGYVNNHIDTNLVEITFESFYIPESVQQLVDKMYAYDYANVYDVLIDGKTIKVYEGNINIILNQYRLDNKSISLEKHEAIVGEKFLEKLFKDYAISNTLKFQGENYFINGILLDTNDIILKNLDSLEQNNIVNQTLYVEKSSKYEYVDKDIIQTALEYRHINYNSIKDYNDLYSVLKVILCFLIAMVCILTILLLIKKLKIVIQEYKKRYCKLNRIITAYQYIKQKNNVLSLLTIICLAVVIIFVFLICVYAMKNLFTTRLPFSINITSIKNLDTLYLLIKEFLMHNFKYGFNCYEIIVLKIGFIYLIIITILLVNIITNIKQLYKK
ncbi:hypothetical protein JYG23_09690 [Sedimentibacter sp. zth1]|uniref:hypothetical protein n=1 Tax=Sedimentibacter sp. zth1 TaxID=2816908 RepID=UPI001A910CA8|nr:hypothetical protein [Sedimentibacter sp. zth1]QSX04961.1 hypothetical protein JYG23_09690 [Sedimentibacter sp. zth1]